MFWSNSYFIGFGSCQLPASDIVASQTCSKSHSWQITFRHLLFRKTWSPQKMGKIGASHIATSLMHKNLKSTENFPIFKLITGASSRTFANFVWTSNFPKWEMRECDLPQMSLAEKVTCYNFDNFWGLQISPSDRCRNVTFRECDLLRMWLTPV